MKTALIVRNNFTQLVCTPENDFEKSIVEGMKQGTKQARITTGYFEQDRDGLYRSWSQHNSRDLIIIFDEKPPPELGTSQDS